jgi:hypothetical protein
MSILDDPRYHYTERFIREANPRGVSAPTAFERGIVRADPSAFGMMDTRNPAQDAAMTAARASDRNMEILPEDDMRPREDIEGEDSIFQVLYDTIIGEQGIPEGVSAEAIAAIRGDFGPTSTPDELREVAQQIENAGGWDQWLASQEDPPTPITDVVEGAVDTVTEGVVTTVQDALDAALAAISGGDTDEEDDRSTVEQVLDWIAENAPEITPQSIFDEYIGAGVGVNLPTGAPIGSGTVFIPGIPGLPSSSPNMVIGTVEEVLEDILAGNLPGVIGDIAEDPVGGIQGVIGGAVDDAQEVTAGDLLGDVDLLLGDDEGIDSVFDEPGQRTDYGGGLNDGETEDILAGVGSGGATSATGVGVQRPTGDFTPFMRRISYTPVAIPKAVVPNAPIISSLFSEYLK